ncbi:MAG: hypothetical protein RI544_04785 [Haloquadratum sp.]|nr:hypothetical protein [Haloquadratum sp.]
MLGILQRAIEIYRSDGTLDLLFAIRRFARYKPFWSKLNYPHKLIFEFNNGSGISVMNKDWDNLIILDACRYDVFQEYSDFNQHELQKVVSKGSWSLEFINSNFAKSTFHDTVYVTANGFCEEIEDGTFFKLVKLYAENKGRRPEVVTESAIENVRKHPDKRLIVHYMQPHVPHLGSIAANIDERIFRAAASGQISDQLLTESYIENFLIVQEHVNKLLRNLEGKTIITSDHGENLGEFGRSLRWYYSSFGPQKKKLYGHGHQTPECRFVPWCEISENKRKKITSSVPLPPAEVDDSTIQKQLKDLGYL